MEERGKASAVLWLTHSVLDQRNTSQGHLSWTWLVSKALHSNKGQICLKFSMGSSWEVSLLPRTQRRWKWTPVCYGGVGREEDSSSGWMRLHTSALYSSWVHLRCVMLRSKINFPLKMLLLEIRKSPGPSLSPKEKSRAQLESSVLAVAHTSEQSNSILVSANSAGGWDEKIRIIPWSYDFVFRDGKVKNLTVHAGTL